MNTNNQSQGHIQRFKQNFNSLDNWGKVRYIGGRVLLPVSVVAVWFISNYVDNLADSKKASSEKTQWESEKNKEYNKGYDKGYAAKNTELETTLKDTCDAEKKDIEKTHKEEINTLNETIDGKVDGAVKQAIQDRNASYDYAAPYFAIKYGDKHVMLTANELYHLLILAGRCIDENDTIEEKNEKLALSPYGVFFDILAKGSLVKNDKDVNTPWALYSTILKGYDGALDLANGNLEIREVDAAEYIEGTDGAEKAAFLLDLTCAPHRGIFYHTKEIDSNDLDTILKTGFNVSDNVICPRSNMTDADTIKSIARNAAESYFRSLANPLEEYGDRILQIYDNNKLIGTISEDGEILGCGCPE